VPDPPAQPERVPERLLGAHEVGGTEGDPARHVVGRGLTLQIAQLAVVGECVRDEPASGGGIAPPLLHRCEDVDAQAASQRLADLLRVVPGPRGDGPGGVRFVAIAVQPSQLGLRRRCAPMVTAGQRRRDGVLVELLRPVELATGPRHRRVAGQRIALPRGCRRGAGQRQLFHGQLGDRGELASTEVEQRAGGEERQPFERAVRSHGLQTGAHPVEAFPAEAAQIPRMPQARDESRSDEWVSVRAEGPFQGRAEVVVLGV
jgi:hypothetical protein